MNMGARIKQRLAELENQTGEKRGPAWLARQAGISVAAVSALTTRGSGRSNFAAKLASALGVTDHWLTDGTMPKLRDDTALAEPVRRPAGTGDERALLELFRDLNPDQRKDLISMAVTLQHESARHLRTASPAAKRMADQMRRMESDDVRTMSEARDLLEAVRVTDSRDRHRAGAGTVRDNRHAIGKGARRPVTGKAKKAV